MTGATRTDYLSFSLIFSVLALTLPLPTETVAPHRETQSEVKYLPSLFIYSLNTNFTRFSLISTMMFSLFYWSFKNWWQWRGLKEAWRRLGRKDVSVQRPLSRSGVTRGGRPCWRCWTNWSRRWTNSWTRTAVCLPSDLQVSWVWSGLDWILRKFWWHFFKYLGNVDYWRKMMNNIGWNIWGKVYIENDNFSLPLYPYNLKSVKYWRSLLINIYDSGEDASIINKWINESNRRKYLIFDSLSLRSDKGNKLRSSTSKYHKSKRADQLRTHPSPVKYCQSFELVKL